MTAIKPGAVARECRVYPTFDLKYASQVHLTCDGSALRAEHLFHGGDLRTWLFTILLNLDRNRRRGLSRRPILAVIEDVDPPAEPTSDGTGRDITRGLSLLPPEQREVLLLVALEGMSYREAADVQGVPIGTVMSRLSRARTTLRTHVDGELPKLRSVP